MTLVVTTLPTAAAQAAYSNTSGTTRAGNMAQQPGNLQNTQNSLASQSAAIVSMTQNSNTRTVSSGPDNKRVDAAFDADKEKNQLSENNEEKEDTTDLPKRLSVQA
jgi:hypothetical protein